MSNRIFLILVLLPNILLSQDKDLPFQVLVTNNATIYGVPVEPLQLVDDVTSIEVAADGFVALVHSGGTTYEMSEKVFTFYLKPEQLKDRKERPKLSVLYEDSTVLDQTKLITTLSPAFDRSGFLVWNKEEHMKVYWHLHDEPVLNYKISIFDKEGNKIQDYRTKHHEYVLKPSTYGLVDPFFSFRISSTFAGETIESKTYSVELQSAPTYEKKAADLVLQALDLELSPILALKVWQEVVGMPNGAQYSLLYQKFLMRNEMVLRSAGNNFDELLAEVK